jgi:hypothetical protein
MMRWTWIAVVLAFALGCKGKEDPGPSCKEVTDHVYEITRKAYPGHGDMMMGNPKTDVARCEARKMSAAQRRCMLQAQSVEALAQCVPREKPDEKKPEARPGTPAPTPPAPTAPPPAAPAPTPPAPQ